MLSFVSLFYKSSFDSVENKLTEIIFIFFSLLHFVITWYIKLN